MKEFFLILFFGKIVLLTPAPIDLIGELELRPPKPLEAITSGAAIQVDVSSMVTLGSGIIELDRKMKELFPPDTIEVTLFSDDNKTVTLHYNGHHYTFSDKNIRLVIGDSELPMGVKFNRVVLVSRIKLTGVQIYWKNFAQ